MHTTENREGTKPNILQIWDEKKDANSVIYKVSQKRLLILNFLQTSKY